MTVASQVDRNSGCGVPFCWHCSGLLPFRKGEGDHSFRLVRAFCRHANPALARCRSDVLGMGITNVPRGTDTIS